MENKIFKMNRWLKSFILEQKCVPWRVVVKYHELKNKIFNINTQKHWDQIWSKEKYIPNSHRFYPKASIQIISLVPLESKVVDIGCGIGILLEKLKNEKRCAGFGIDISKEAIKAIREKGFLGVSAKVPPIPLPANSFDIATATELLEHVNNPKAFIREMIRIIRPSGSLIITTPDNALAPYAEREHVNAFNEKALMKLFNEFREIQHIRLLRVKETDEEFNRFVISAKKCQKLA